MARTALDLKKFKHVSSDNHSTTLQHSNGHLLTIAHNKLAPEFRVQLEALAKGGKVHEEDTSVQGKDVRYANKAAQRGNIEEHKQGMDYAKSEAKGRAEFEREAVKPKLKGLAEGGKIRYYSKGGDIDPLQTRDEANYAYNAGLPCRNPNCKSMGHPHPNCRCYSSASHFSKGGRVKHFCEEANEHLPDCEHYKKPEQDLDRLPAADEAMYARKHNMAEGGRVKETTAEDLRKQTGFWESEHGKKALGRAQEEVKNVKKSVENTPPSEVGAKYKKYMKDGGNATTKSEIPLKTKAMAVGLPPEAGSDVINTAYEGWQRNHPEAHEQLQIQAQQNQEAMLSSQTKKQQQISQEQQAGQQQKASANRFSNPQQEQAYEATLANQAAYEKQLQANSARDADPNFNPDLGPDPADKRPVPVPIVQPQPTQQSSMTPMEGPIPNEAQGGKVRKMYADPYEAISQDDDAPHGATGSWGDDDNAKMPALPEEKTDEKRANKIHSPDTYGHPQELPTVPSPQSQTAPPEDLTTVPTPNMSGPGTGMQSSNPVQRFADVKQNLYQNYSKEDQAWANDLDNGHITPLTYRKLMYYNDDGSPKSTLGKLGSMFSLLVSGAGSGLAHQPNVVLGMMQQTINNDLDAQKQSKANAQNYLRLAQQHEMQKANINNLNTQTALAVNTAAQQKMNRVAFHSFVQQANAYPQGSPEQQKAYAVLTMLKPQLDQTNSNLADRAATAGAALSIGQTQNNPGNDSEASFKARQSALQMSADPNLQARAQYESDRHIPGVQGLASKPIPDPARDKIQSMQILDNKVKDVLNYAQQHAGSVDPRVVATAKQKAEELTAFYNKSVDSLGMTEGRLSWLEEQIKKNPTSIIQQLMGNNSRLAEIRDSNAARQNQILSGKGGLGFPPQAPSQPSAPQIKIDTNGVKWQRGPNGEALRVK